MCEALDELELPEPALTGEKADFLLDERRVVCELKSLQSDIEPRLEKLLAPHKDRTDWPVFYGTWPIENIFRLLPDGAALRQQVAAGLVAALDGIYRKANRQVRATKTALGLTDSFGLLVLLNDAVDALSPPLLSSGIDRLMRERNGDGSSRYRHIDLVWVISGTHYAEISPGVRGHPSMIFLGDLDPSHPAVCVVRYVHARWATYCGLPLREDRSGPNFEPPPFRKWDRDETPDRLPHQERWRRNYLENPYLRELDEEALLEKGVAIMTGMLPYMLKGTVKPARSRFRWLTERWAHFLEEMNHRGVDMRRFGQRCRDSAEINAVRQRAEAARPPTVPSN